VGFHYPAVYFYKTRRQPTEHPLAKKPAWCPGRDSPSYANFTHLRKHPDSFAKAQVLQVLRQPPNTFSPGVLSVDKAKAGFVSEEMKNEYFIKIKT
jgi:hypothetical protein